MKVRAGVWVLMLCLAVPVMAHGVRITHEHDTTNGSITIHAVYDSGQPLAEAQVTIFAPDDLINPWMTTVTDETGFVTFTPDYALEGNWDVQVRLAGHGGLYHLALTSDMAGDARATTQATTQATTSDEIAAQAIAENERGFMAAVVVALLVGIAGFFTINNRKGSSPHAHS